MLLILAPSASSWSEKPKSTLELMFELPHRAELMFPCSIQMAPRHLWYASEWAWGRQLLRAAKGDAVTLARTYGRRRRRQTQ